MTGFAGAQVQVETRLSKQAHFSLTLPSVSAPLVPVLWRSHVPRVLGPDITVRGYYP